VEKWGLYMREMVLVWLGGGTFGRGNGEIGRGVRGRAYRRKLGGGAKGR